MGAQAPLPYSNPIAGLTPVTQVWKDFFLTLQPKEWGQATLVAGAATVRTTNVQASSLIFLTRAGDSGTPSGVLRVSTIVNGESFTIKSSSGTDTGKVNWMLIP
jgi:hypothetical protein